MEFCGHNPDDGDGDERTADGECDEGLLHEVSFSDHGDRVTHDPSGAGTLGPRPIGRSGSADRSVHTDAARLFAISAGLSTMPVDGVTAPESEGSSDGSHPSATEAGARKSPGSVSDPGLSQVEMAGIEPASVGRLSGLLRAQFVKQFLRFWPLHEHMDQRTELSKSPSDTPNEYLKQWLPKRRQAPERKRLSADGFAARALSGSEGEIGAVVRLSTYCFAEDINEMTLPSRPASPDAVSNVETDHPHIHLPNLARSGLRTCGFLGWTGTPAYSVNAGRANRIPASHGRLGAHRRGDGGIRTSDFTASPGRNGLPDRQVPPVSEELLGLHRAFGLALVLRLAQSLPLVPFALALGQSDLDLDPRAVEVEFERHQRPAGLLDLLREFEDLLPVEQQLPPTPSRMVRPRSLQVFGDVDVLQP